jgi:hypothetical protein
MINKIYNKINKDFFLTSVYSISIFLFGGYYLIETNKKQNLYILNKK